ncbi:MAG: hypothetical protein WCI68_02130 [Actinomycetes bacterium]
MIWFLLPIGLTGTILLTLIGYLHGVDTFRANEHQAEVIALAAISRTGAISQNACEIAIRLGAVECYIDSESIWVTGQEGGHARAGWPEQ